MLICPVVLGVEGASAGVNDFYFSDFTADYYLSKDAEGVSHLRVVEQLTAEFPDYDQNKGIRREIPFANQGGINTVLPNLTRNDIKVLRNGEPEPIWDISRNGDYYSVETGTDDYVLGTQIYTLEYEFEKVVTDFGDHQELYWDTNGTGWPQRFSQLTARLHFDDESVWTGEAWCYVGSYGQSGQNRCTITETSDGVEFSANNLGVHENLTFDVEFLPNSFVVPEPEKDYTLLIVAGVVIVGCLAFLAYKIKKYQETAQKIKEYKGIFVAPQYQPHPEYSLAEMAEVYLGKKKDVKVGVLLDLIVKKKIELHKKGDEGIDIKRKWALVVKDVDMPGESMIVLQILANKIMIKNGDVIELESRISTQMLMELGKQFDRTVLDNLKKDGLVDGKYKIGDAKALSVLRGMVTSVWTTVVVLGGIFMVIIWLTDGATFSFGVGKELVMGKMALAVMALALTITLTAVLWMNDRVQTIGSITTKGMKASKYMEGLKLYIEMAEAERMKMLQSVKGVDTTPEGIVKLYEKLLPYAAVFGLEESWMNEMKEFCNAKEVVGPDYLMTGIAVSQLSRTMRSAAGYASSSGHTIAGGGSYSSSSSGGGGGGFSGGGGGGGGGGGR